MTNCVKINDNLYLVSKAVQAGGGGGGGGAVITTTVPQNHIWVVDCSGSMSSDLPKIREQAKRKLPKLVKPGDTMTIIWFSGKGEFGCLLEGEPVADLTDLNAVNQTIDRWLRPVGLTGFKEPIVECSNVIERIAKKNPGSLFSLLFMSDGHDNQWGRNEILKAVEDVSGKLANATFVEYGYYADRALLTDMATKAGGSLIFAADFDQYAPKFELAISRQLSGARKVDVDIEGDTLGGFAWSTKSGEILTYDASEGKVSVLEDTKEIYYLSPAGVATDYALEASPEIYAAMSLYAQRMKSSVVLALLKTTGDVRFIDQFSVCFGKQKYSEFVADTAEAAFDESKRLQEGYDPNRVPAEDAFTVLDLLDVLANDEENRVLLDSKDFKYSRVSRGRVDSNEVLSDEEQAEIEGLKQEMANTKDAKKVKELADKITAIADKPDALKFVADENEEGYPISALKYNEDRPNISMLVRKTGVVDISKRDHKSVTWEGDADSLFKTFIFRNYTVIKDGLVNMDKLPVRMTAGTIKALKKAGMPETTILGLEGEDDAKARARVTKASKGRMVEVVFDLKSLPIINRKMVKDVSAVQLFKNEYELTRARCSQKIFNTYTKEMFPPAKSAGWVDIYGQAACDWLKEQGITESGGFAPKMVQAPSTDFYVGKELKVSLKGYSTIPAVKDVVERIKSGKHTAVSELMASEVAMLELLKERAELSEDILTNGAFGAKMLTRHLIAEMAKDKFAIVVGQAWPSEFKSLDDNTLTVEVHGNKIEGKIEMRDVTIKL